ncbi:MAG: hypothetical protein LPK19_02620 [Hymenobacteraceae bacterium]|nr:hypothetical protein [Hymenobacteraceae bacterium]MDX5395077.1 hypothetical protein [Hymenobacteraceae bacterium]MDX5511114.1 hypothetical protein [Hymenobacteraceae bacterium]
MENFTDYLDPELVPLEEKIKAYLDVDKELKHMQIELENAKAAAPEFDPEKHDLQQTISEGKHENQLSDIQNKIEDLEKQQNKLKAQIIDLLPVKDQYIKVDLGYGPSEVGAFTRTDRAQITGHPDYDLMIIH